MFLTLSVQTAETVSTYLILCRGVFQDDDGVYPLSNLQEGSEQGVHIP
jgi:hypothetical protein